MGGLGLRRPTSSSSRTDRRAGTLPALVAVLVSATLVATCASPGPTVSPGASTPPATSPGPSASPGGAWTKLELPAVARVARLEPTLAGAGGVSPDTAFRLTSLAGAPVADLATRLVATPGLELQVTETAGDTAILTPAAPLEQGRVYRFELVRTDGTAEAAWAVQAAWPLRIASTIPGDGSTDVPRDTGIELAFDQAGVRLEDLRTHVSISPQVAGRFEPHGLTFAYVPDEPLLPSTLYTVTVRRGLPLPGTGMTLEQDAVYRFETTGDEVSRVHLTAARPLFDAGTRERPVLSVRVDIPWDEEAGTPVEQVAKLPVTVHRLPGLDAAIDAFLAVRGAPDWTVRTGSAPVPTGDLPQVMRGTVRLRELDSEESAWFRLPARLPAGWYVVTMTYAGIPRQTILQVTDVAVFAMVSDTRSLVWANDLRTNAPIRRARVLLGDQGFGRTDAEGLVMGRTPAALVDALDTGGRPVAIVRSGTRAAFVPLAASWWCGECGDETAREWWHLLTLDRERYRASDTVNAWGVVRNRDTGDVPGSVTVRLIPDADGGGVAQPAVASVTATPDASGAFLAQLAYRNVPAGNYRVSVQVGDETVASSWLSVGPIAKPAWQVELSAPHRAVVTGTSVPVSAVATFFEGTPVAGAELRFGDSWDDGEEPPPLATTDAGGRASAQLVLRQPEEESVQWTELGVTARASEPEEGDISTEIPMVVFASTAVLDAQSVIRGRRLVVTGAVHDVDLARYDVAGADLGSVDPRGAPRAGAKVTVQVIEITPVVRRTGTTYDFIAKRAVPTYDLTERRRSLGTRTVTTASDGRFRLAIPVKAGDRSYEVATAYVDEAGRRITQSADAWVETDLDHRWPTVESEEESGEYAVGDMVKVRFRHGIRDPEVQRYLFAVMARGLRTVSVQDSARFTMRFTAGLVPNASITGVRFTGTAYEPAVNAYTAGLRTADRSLSVALAADRERYEPGDPASVSIRVRDAAGRPVAASVFVRAVDEKLFRMGGATADDPLGELYASTDSGLIATAWSHATVRDDGDGKGDTGGGDTRADFRDWVVARLVSTDADGRASVSFDLPDDLTSWRVLASAVTPGLLAGAGSMALPVGLPFFAEATVAPQYLAADRPVVRVRAYGSALAAGEPVTFRLSSDTLPMAVVALDGRAFEPVEAALPPLSVGTHRLTIEASAGTGAGRRTDTLIRTFEVVETRTVRTHVASVPLVAGTTVGGGDGPTTVILVDAGRGRVVPALRELAVTETFRADSAIAAAIARDVLGREFGIPDSPGLPEPDLLAFQPGNGISLLPYASEELDLSAMAAFSGEPRLDRSRLHSYFENVVDEATAEAGGSLPIDRELSLLLGRASLGEASIGEVTAAAALAGLEPSQRVKVALAALALGDEVLAREIYLELLGEHGQRQGPWVRLDTGDEDATAVATARLAIVAAALGDPLAADMDAEITAHPPADTLVDLERAIAAASWAHRVPKADAVAAVTIDGRRSEVTITPDEPVVLDVTPAQRAGLRIDPVDGSVLVTSQWDGPVTAGDLAVPEGLGLTRIATPTEAIEPTQTVVVRFQVRLGQKADDGCWRVTDFAPSGLAPISTPGRWEEGDDEEEGDPAALGPETPWRVVGQRVDFCVVRDPRNPVHDLRYLARVVTPGTYRWEPAVLQSSMVPEEGVVLAPFEVTIGGLGAQ